MHRLIEALINTMNESDISKYCNLMEEVKRRMNVIDALHADNGRTLYEATAIESIYLQFRKILELVAMGSLIANKKIMTDAYKNIEKSWNAEYILNDIKRLNPDFYPKPIVEKPSSSPEAISDWENKNDDYLTQREFVKLYKRAGAIAHADNPLGKKTNYGSYKSQVLVWRKKIMNLLNSHLIRLVSDENIYLIHMKEDRDNKVHGYTFSPVKKNS